MKSYNWIVWSLIITAFLAIPSSAREFRYCSCDEVFTVHRIGKSLRVNLEDNVAVTGTVIGYRNDTLYLVTSRAPLAGNNSTKDSSSLFVQSNFTTPIHKSSIRELYAHSGSAHQGMAVGAVLGVFGAFIVASIMDSLMAYRIETARTLEIIGLGIIIGGAVGGVVGSFIPRFELVYWKPGTKTLSRLDVKSTSAGEQIEVVTLTTTFEITPESYRPPDGRAGITTVTANIGIRIAW